MKKLVESIKDLFLEINFDISASGIAIQGMDNSHISLVQINITSNDSIGACMGFNRSNKKRNTLGGSWIIGHDFIFDRENKLLGFVV